MMTLPIIAAALGFFIVILWPAAGAYLFLVLGPLIVGIARTDSTLPLRPNEALMLLIVVALGARRLLLMLCHRYHAAKWDRLDKSLFALTVTSSLLPLVWRSARGFELTKDDLLYALVMAKYFVVFRVFRNAITTDRQIAICLQMSMASAVLVAIIAMFQVLHLFGVPEFLRDYYENPFNDPPHVKEFIDRATSTLALSFGVADMMIMNVIIALAMRRTAKAGRWLLLFAAGSFVSACIAAGEISTYIGMAVAVIAFGLLTGSLQRLGPTMLIGTMAALPFWPVVERRLSALHGVADIPSTWEVRWWNLEHVFFPQLASGNWLLGVEPAGRVPAPDGYIWGLFVYIESGYVWLLWVGGVPLLLAFAYFCYVSLGKLRRTALKMDGSPVGAAATASFCFLVAMLVMMLFDPHLTMRGSADLFFPLLAISSIPSAVENEVHRPHRAESYRQHAQPIISPNRATRRCLQPWRRGYQRLI